MVKEKAAKEPQVHTLEILRSTAAMMMSYPVSKAYTKVESAIIFKAVRRFIFFYFMPLYTSILLYAGISLYHLNTEWSNTKSKPL